MMKKMTSGMLLSLSLAAWATAQEPAKEETDPIKLALSYLSRVEMRSTAESADAIPLIDKPLERFADTARSSKSGTLWAWGKTGRPAAFLELWHNTEETIAWYSITLTGNRVSATFPTIAAWKPDKVQVEPVAIPGAPVPDANQAVRLRQIKDLSRRFTAHEFWDPDNSRFELRLMVQPVHRYQDAKGGLVDGAAFVFAHGTNPELILLIEAIGPSPEKARWHYGVARTGSAEFHVEIDGKEVWKRDRTPNISGSPNEAYWLFRGPVALPRAVDQPKPPAKTP
jgi:hypothetical protein